MLIDANDLVGCPDNIRTYMVGLRGRRSACGPGDVLYQMINES